MLSREEDISDPKEDVGPLFIIMVGIGSGGIAGEYVRDCNAGCPGLRGTGGTAALPLPSSLATRDAMAASWFASPGWVLATLSSGAGKYETMDRELLLLLLYPPAPAPPKGRGAGAP